MKLRIAEKILDNYFKRCTKLYGNTLPLRFAISNDRERKALKICKKFKNDEYWPFKLQSDGRIIIIIGG